MFHVARLHIFLALVFMQDASEKLQGDCSIPN